MNNNLDSFNESATNKRLDIKSDPTLPDYVAKKTDDSGISAKVISYHDPLSSITENYRTIYTHLKNTLLGSNDKILAITSASDNEGKTVTAVNLAVVIARDFKKRVLLIDANLRNPDIDEILTLKNDEGLSGILSSGLDYKKAIKHTTINNLSVITAGREIQNQAELLHSNKLNQLFDAVRPDYDLIICDTPGIMSFSDTKIISSLADGIVLVIRSRKTRREVIDRAEEILKELHCRLFGFILTDIEYHIPEFLYKYL